MFTDFVPTIEQQYSAGWMMIWLVVALLAVNMLVVLKIFAGNVGLVYVKCYNRFEKCWGKVQKQDEKSIDNEDFRVENDPKIENDSLDSQEHDVDQI